jgi:putative molybdopterin biosynthesis protein
MASRTTPFLRDVPLASALQAWRECRAAAGCPERTETITLSVQASIGRVTAEPIWARRSSPPFDAAAMDGIAVRAADTVGAGESTPLLLGPDAFTVLDTGDPIPDGFDAVVMREHVHYVDGRAELRAAVAPYQHVRSIGEDISATELLLPAGHRLRPVDAAAAAAAGVTEIRARRAPVVRCGRWAQSSPRASCSRRTR